MTYFFVFSARISKEFSDLLRKDMMSCVRLEVGWLFVWLRKLLCCVE